MGVYLTSAPDLGGKKLMMFLSNNVLSLVYQPCHVLHDDVAELELDFYQVV